MTFLVMIGNVWSGRSNRLLLALPILWFGGYAIATTVSHIHAFRFDAAIAAANGPKRLDFVKERHDILIDPDGSMDRRRLSHDVLVKEYSLERAYQFVREGIQEAAVVHSACPKGRRAVPALYWAGVGASNLCIRFSLAKPSKPGFRVKVHKAVNRTGLTNTTAQQIDIITPDGRSVSLMSGRSTPLSWFPMPMIGCIPMGTGSSSGCVAMMLRENFGARNIEIPNSQMAVFAKAFGLARMSMHERYPDAEWFNPAPGLPENR